MATSQDSTKRCPKCGEDKVVAEFYTDRRRRDGLSPRCKACIYTRIEKRTIPCAECGVVFTTVSRRGRVCSAEICQRADRTKRMAAWRANPENHDRNIANGRRSDARRSLLRTPESKAEKRAYMTRYTADPARRFRIDLGARERLYGITAADWDRLIIAQCGHCAICSVAFGRTKLRGAHVDHDHTTGVVRGLLCGHCNQALGLFHESTDTLRAAAEYLLLHRESK